MLTDPAGAPLLLFSNPDCRISLSRREAAMPFYVRYVDGDLLCFVHQGAGRLETEFGPLTYRPGDWIYLPKACTWRQTPDTGGQERSDSGKSSTEHLADHRGHRRVPGAAGRARSDGTGRSTRRRPSSPTRRPSMTATVRTTTASTRCGCITGRSTASRRRR